MDLIEGIKQKRDKQRQKQLFRRGVYNQISGLVRWYGLKENFLDVLDKVEDYLSNIEMNYNRVRVKAPVESPLFSLVNKDEYDLTMSIIKKIDNPYLKFAHSPDEILLCGPLYRLNSSLNPEKLKRYHFETLFLHERTKANNVKQDGMLTKNN